MSDNSVTATAAAAAAAAADWRSAVEQSYRNSEVREIAKVLAALEPGASAASKLRLAMQFEDSIFKQATSLADYRKKLTKRLKKVQKSYVPTPQATATANKEQAILKLRQKYGDALQYILKNAPQAVKEMRIKHGDEKAEQLKSHTDSVKLWAKDLGILHLDTNNSSSGSRTQQANLRMSDEHLQKLTDHLERRIENIRCHVVKLADPDRFFVETLEKTASELKARPAAMLAANVRKRYAQVKKVPDFDPSQLLKESMEQALEIVPIPKRNQENNEKAALIHLDKMRAASTAILSYMAIREKPESEKNTIVKAHTIAAAGIDFVTKVIREHRRNNIVPDVSLEDAWMRPLVLEQPPESNEEEVTATTTGDGSSPPPQKRSKRGPVSSKPVLRSRILLTPGSKTPSRLLPALKMKRAKLIRPSPAGQCSHIVLNFGEAFVMTIYLVPLLVTLRAYNKEDEKENNDTAFTTTSTSSSSSSLQYASWTPLHSGLTDQQELTVWGAKGNYEEIGGIVEERLRDASAQATQVLRKCFDKNVKESNSNGTPTSDMEILIMETSALLEFIQLARSTYMPNWRDDSA